MNYRQKLLYLILLIICLTPALAWSQYAQIRTGRWQMVNITTVGQQLNSSSIPVSYNISYTSPITQTTSCGIGIVGFKTFQTNDFSINITIVNFLVNSMRITAIAFDDTIVTYLAVNYIAVGSPAPFIEVQFFCFLPSLISIGNDTREDTRTGTTLFNTQTILCNVYLSGFRVHNSEGLINYLQASVKCPAATGNLNYKFQTNQNNTVLQVCYTTIIFCQVCTKVLYWQWGEIGSQWLSGSSASVVSPILGRYQNADRQFYGISAFNMNRGATRYFDIDTASNTFNVNSFQDNGGNLGVKLDHFFIAVRGCNTSSSQKWFKVTDQTCDTTAGCTGDNLYPTLDGSAYFCYTCFYTCFTCDGSLVNNCTDCVSANYRTFDTGAKTCNCVTGYIDIGLPLCYPCQYFMPGCTSCLSTKLCQLCGPGFTLNAFGTCQCTFGFLITSVCTNITGCISATNLQGTVYCLACNATLYFVKVNYTCVCMTGYIQNALGNCVSTCGDTYVTFGQGCDDGNTLGGDGCSNICQVETNWMCDNTVRPSKCFISMNYTGQVKYVRRITNDNQAQFGILINPINDAFNYVNFKSYITTNLPCNNYSTRYQSPLLIINCQYPYTIENNNYQLNITLDPTVFNNSTMKIKLPAVGMNAKLTYDTNYSMSFPLSVLVIILDVFAIIVLFVTCITERMIGVQMIQTLHSVLYVMAIMRNCPATLTPLQALKYSFGFNGLGGTDYTRNYPYTFSVGQVGIEKQFLLTYNLTYIILILLITIALILKLVLLNIQKQKLELEAEYNQKVDMAQFSPNYRNIKLTYKFIFERIFFVVAFTSMFIIIFGGGIQLSDLQADYIMLTKQFNLLACGVGLCILVTFLSMVIINGIYPKLDIFPMFMDKKYPCYYVIYQSTFIILLTFVYTQKWMIFVMAAFTAVNLITLVVWRPYDESVHNVTLFVNQSVILLAEGTYLFDILSDSKENNQAIMSILVIAIIIGLFIVILLAIYRLYRFWKYMKEKGLSYNDGADADMLEYKKLTTPRNGDTQMKQRQPKYSDAKQGNEQARKKLFQPEQDDYYNDIKKSSMKNPINNKDKSGANTGRKMAQQIDYDTFNANKSKNKPQNNSTFQIDRIDPNASRIDKSSIQSPYDEYGNVKLHNVRAMQDDYDALKAIKARLKKDFYQKVHGVDYKPEITPSQVKNELSRRDSEEEDEDEV